ncbi:pre-rRNA-processing protein esf1 [Sporothrix stenoceras]|uniref:Pre-rRNA-processing protein esf1 n=1 Tax=Sporothrix stenoceras TaxID=5173 RepID=A0ABR3YUA9_9PEZI
MGKKERSGSPSRINDARFAKFESDPRYRLPSKRNTKTKLDKRFGQVLKDKDFTATTQIDRYGRKLKSDKKKKALERLYEVDDDEEDKDSEDDDKESEDEEPAKASTKKSNYDAARGGGFSASESDDDDEDDESDGDLFDEEEEEEDAADTQQFREEQAEVPTGEITHRLAIVNLDWDHVKSRDLMAMFSSFVPKEGRGKIEKISVYPSQFGKERMQREELEGPPREIFKGKDESGDEDSDASDSERSEDDEDSEEEDEKVKKELLREENDTDFDSNALRSYQLDRLRYYYAVMVCSDKATAEAIYNATDGTEYQSSSNFIDLRFVPDDTTFDDDEPRDECTEIPSNYKPVEFVTNALQHSKVKLTWDMHPEDTSRKDLMNKAFSGTPAELIENDLRAYLASDSDGEDGFDDDGEEFGGVEEVEAEEVVNNDDEEDDEVKEKAEKPKLSKKELARQKMRAALGLSEESEKKSSSSKKNAPVGGMQITFTPALSDGAAAEKKSVGPDGVEETTLEKYKRKEKERKEKRKQKAIAKREGRDPNAEAEVESDVEVVGGPDGDDDAEDLGFNDPFFMDDAPAAGAGEPSKSSIRKEERLKKRAQREAEEKEKAESRAQLEALMGADGEDIEGAGHFDMRDVMKAEKARQKEERKKNRKNHNRRGDGDGEDEGAAADFSAHGIDASDPRLQAVFGGAEFAIDPSNPQYKDTLGLQQMQNEARRKRKDNGAEEDDASSKTTKKAKTSSRNDELANLIKSVKSKAKKNKL